MRWLTDSESSSKARGVHCEHKAGLMNSVSRGWFRGSRSFVKLVGRGAALSGLLAAVGACSSDFSDALADQVVGAGGTAAIQTSATEPGTSVGEVAGSEVDSAASVAAFVASEQAELRGDVSNSDGNEKLVLRGRRPSNLFQLRQYPTEATAFVWRRRPAIGRPSCPARPPSLPTRHIVSTPRLRGTRK
jgi:hypothetical protein